MAIRKSLTRWLIAAAVLLLFIVVLVVLERTLTFDDVSKWILRIGMVLLGLIAAGAVLWFLRPRGAEPALDPGDDVTLVIGGARARLPGRSFGSRALVLLVGPEGSSKSTLAMRSGGDPERLAGDAIARPGDAPPPTKTANVWAMQQSLVVELTSTLLSSAPRWRKVVRSLRAPRLAAAIGRGEAAPRAAVVCVPCDLFYSGANGQQLASLGVTLRQRLAEASRELGLALPVYVMFTKMDRIPQFEPWISVFTKDELRAPLGATLPLDAGSDTGNYAERLSPRIDAALRHIVDNIGARRVELLRRDAVQERRYGAYELPRELRKLGPSIATFLIELCRPTQLGSSPLLRGFYFTGARPVVVSDVAQSPVAKAAPGPQASDATAIFRQAMQPAAAAAAIATPTTRKVPEWVFLDRFLRDVVLSDKSAASIAGGGVRVHHTRRMVLGGAIAASLLILLAVTVSWLGNRALTTRVADAASAVAALPVVQSAPGTVAFPSADALRRLDVLRAQLDTVRDYVKDGPPLRLRFGLWQGPALIDAARPVWYEGFRRQLFAIGWGAIVDSLKALPEMPTTSNDYGTTYGWLKGYLITTTAPDSSTVEFLAPVLFKSWQRGQATDADVSGLARRQFEFYAAELPTFNPFPKAADAALVTKSREFLARFTGGEQIYRNMLAAADKQVPAVKVPQAPGILTATPEVPGSFSAKGATFMADAFRNSDQYFQNEKWVVGDAKSAVANDRETVVAALKSRYRDDYVRTWRQVVQSAKVVSPSTVKDAADKLEQLSSPASPILQVLRLVASNTNGDSVVRATFQPVHAVSPPDILDKYVTDKSKPYVDGLAGLAGAVRQLGNLPPPTDTISTQDFVKQAQLAGNDVTKALVAEKSVAQGFTLTAEAEPMARAVGQLLVAPINGAEAVLKGAQSLRPPTKRIVIAAAPAPPPPSGGGGGGGPSIADKLNERGRSTCSQMAPVLAKFPFDPDAKSDASMEEITQLLAPGTGALWTFYQEKLKDFLEKQGNAYVAKPVGSVALSGSFVQFFNRAAQVSAALFPGNSPTPRLKFTAIGRTSDLTPEILLKHGGKEARFNSRTPENVIDWPAASGREAQLEAVFKKNKAAVVATGSGEWALFKLVAQAASFQGSGRVEWAAPKAKDAVPVVVEFSEVTAGGSGLPMLKRGWLGGMICVPQVTQ